MELVTARVVGNDHDDSYGSYMIRQGVLDGHHIIGEFGNRYRLTPQHKYTIVSDKNLRGPTLAFVKQQRRSIRARTDA